MSTRESMRRELKELAKLADTIGKAPSIPPPQPLLSAPPPPPIDLMPREFERPIGAGESSALIAPPSFPSTPSPVSIYSRPPKRGGGGGFVAMVGVGFVVALVGGVVLGKTLAKRGAATDTATAIIRLVTSMTRAPAVQAPAVTVIAPVASTAIAPPVAPAEATAAPAAAPEAEASSVAAPEPPPKLAAAPETPKSKGAATASTHAKRHWSKPVAHTKAPAPNASEPVAMAENTPPPAPAAPAPAKAAPAKTAPSKASAGTSGGGESLEDLIRAEVNGSKK